MPTCNRRQFAGRAVRLFLAQDHPQKELIIVDDGSDPIADLLPKDPQIRYFRQGQKQVLGAKRNLACEQARGEIIVHWDDDDWSAPWRLRYQVAELLGAQADICGIQRVFFYAPGNHRAWEYVYPGDQRRWVYGASLCYTKSFWQAHRFPELHVGEDMRFIWSTNQAKIHALPDTRFLVAVIHEQNTSPKRTADSRYHPLPPGEIEQLIGEDFSLFRPSENGAGAPAARPVPARPPVALVTAALGIGDILRVTPLVRVLHRLGHVVDVLVATDYPDSVLLLQGAPEIRRVFHAPGARCKNGPVQINGLFDQQYDVATFTTWSANWRERVNSRRALAFERQSWLAQGDAHCVERIARELGWEGELPPPFAMASNRRFGLAPGTIAIHPGCKYEWPWKKWHGFDELSRRFSNVAVVGTEEDARTDNTYFRRPFDWPDHVQNFIGQLNLPDTAALLRECAALVANDSGLMHLGVALGLPTFGLFGITSPQREAMRSPNMIVVTKKLPCEPDCRKSPWGRRDCDRHLDCLKSLTPDEVFMKVSEVLPTMANSGAQRAASPPESEGPPKETVNLIYYGWVFDASGYGQAARRYVHALHRAGINLSVIDLSGQPRAVNDPLVDALVNRKVDADFHLFHGIPPHWARHAFPLRNVIGMTVWETDTMPTQWRPALNHALDVWLPCDFNTVAFSRALDRPVFKLPHPVSGRPMTGPPADEPWRGAGIGPGDFVFYSIFEWQ
ncbi:MAG TPA: glycosyltransferase, partial [Candidatus Acidoferrales bacterium]|nr:glycosyltransferase [Candidatus Acidoferrales bacterium]